MQRASDRSRLSLEDPEPNALRQTFRVARVRLDQHLPEGRIAVLKIDVEGHEEAVLEGLGEEHASAENVLCEILPTDPGHAEPLAKWLRDRSFVVRTVMGDPWEPGSPLPESNLWAGRVP